MEADVIAAKTASGQHGLITRAQAVEAGLSDAQIRWRARSGRWLRLRPGVFAIAGTPRTWEQRVLAMVLACGDGAVASHATAAALHGFPNAEHDRLEVTLAPGRQVRALGFIVHRPNRLLAHDLTVLGGIPVTSYARTLIDCTGSLSLGQLAQALDAGLVSRSVTLSSIERSLLWLEAGPGRRPSPLRTLLDERGAGAKLAESRPEMRLARLITQAGLPPPVQQHWVRFEADRFRLDFAYPDHKVAIEYDGWDAHRSRTSFDADRRRDRILQLAGWTVLRITSKTSDAELVAALRTLVTPRTLND
jgi:hypothetical protein